MKHKGHQTRATKFVMSYCSYSTKKAKKGTKKRLQQQAAQKVARYNQEY